MAMGIMDTMETAHETAAPRDKRWRGDDPAPVPAGMQTMTRQEVAQLWGVVPRVVTRYVNRGLLTKYVTEGSAVLGRPGRVVFSAQQAREINEARTGEDTGPDPEDGQRKRW